MRWIAQGIAWLKGGAEMVEREGSDPRRFAAEPLQTTEGETWADPTQGAENIEGGAYEGPEVGRQYPWKCPRCGVENSGALEAGCVSCKSGSAQPYKVSKVATPPPRPTAPPPPRRTGTSPLKGRPLDDDGAIAFEERPPRMTSPVTALSQADSQVLRAAAESWCRENFARSSVEAFLAGYLTGQAEGGTGQAKIWSQEGRSPRTIVAALAYFAETLHPGAEEVDTGEWASREEIEELIAQFKERS